MSLNKVLPIHKACLTKEGAFKPYSRVHISKGRAMSTNGKVVVVWNLNKLRQTDDDKNEEEVLTTEVIEYLEGKSVTAQYWEAIVKANEVYVVADGDHKNLEIIQDGRSFVLHYSTPDDKETYIEQIAKSVKLESAVNETSTVCLLWDELEIVKKSLGVSATTKVNMIFNGPSNAVKIVPENGYDCFAVCKVENNETNMFILDDFKEFVEDFLTVGDTFDVKIGNVKTEPKETKQDVPQPENQLEILDTINEEESISVLELDVDEDELPI